MKHRARTNRASFTVACVVVGWFALGAASSGQEERSSISGEFAFSVGKQITIDQRVGDVHLDSLTVYARQRGGGYRLSIHLAAANPYDRDQMLLATVKLADEEGNILAESQGRRGVGAGSKKKTLKMQTDVTGEPESTIFRIRLTAEAWDRDERSKFTNEYGFSVGTSILVNEFVGRVQFESLIVESKLRTGGHHLVVRLFGRNDGGHDQMVAAAIRLTDEAGKTVAWGQGQNMIEEEGKRNRVKMEVDVTRAELSRITGMVLEITAWDE